LDNAISKNFDTPKLIKFALPTIVMMVVLSLYTTVDGAFVAKLVSEDALASINIVYPLYSVYFAISLMMATGANAIIAKNLGQGRNDEARSFFTLIYILAASIAVVLGLAAFFFSEQILSILGSTPRLSRYTTDYLRYMALFVPVSFLQIFTQTFFITNGKPALGMGLIILGGLTNVVLDYVFIGVCDMGIAGAAIATGIGNCIPGLFGVIYFIFNRKGSLYFVKPSWNGKKLLFSLFNGSSEFVNNIAASITTVMFNYSMLKYLGESGIAAISAILYLQFIQASVFFGFSGGVAPIISYKYGEENHAQLKHVVGISLRFILCCSVFIFVLSLILSGQAVSIFIRPDSKTFDLARHGFALFSLSYLFMGFNIFSSAMFTALSNGKVSALLSILRTLVFIVGALFTLPLILGVSGIWLAVPVAEALALIVAAVCFYRLRPRYHY
jgi:putative MATE family efflux protein